MRHSTPVGVLLHRWPTPLLEGRLVRRYERFIAEVRLLDGRLVRAHCVNPGRMEGMVIAGARVWLSRADSSRALPFTWELIELEGELVGANTGLPNALVRSALEGRHVRGFGDARAIVPEQRLGRHHRVDFRLDTPRGPHWVEVKNCHLVYPDRLGYFPDSKSERAVRHVSALMRRVKRGERATVLFTLQRTEVIGLRPSVLHAPGFAKMVWKAARAGVRFRALRLCPTLEGVEFVDEVPVDVAPYSAADLEAWCRGYDSTSGWVRKDGKLAGRSLFTDAPSPS